MGGKLSRMFETPANVPTQQRGVAEEPPQIAPDNWVKLAQEVPAAVHHAAVESEEHRVALRSSARNDLVQKGLRGDLVSALMPALTKRLDLEPVRKQTYDMVNTAFLNGTLLEALKQASCRTEIAGS